MTPVRSGYPCNAGPRELLPLLWHVADLSHPAGVRDFLGVCVTAVARGSSERGLGGKCTVQVKYFVTPVFNSSNAQVFLEIAVFFEFVIFETK